MKFDNVEKLAYGIIGVTILLYLIGGIRDIDEYDAIIYNWFGIPVLFAGASWIGLQMSTPEAKGRKLLNFLLKAALVYLALLFLGWRILALLFFNIL
ncbi:MAG: hypothetical protein LIP01_04475 [Tannerellaceae bacterium]|nr:hypothetical protein [Tannerellaceae bacterium]